MALSRSAIKELQEQVMMSLVQSPFVWCGRLFKEPWWAAELGHRPAAYWLAVTDVRKLAALPLRVRQGFLNATSDLLAHLGSRLAPYLPEILAVLLSLLRSAPIAQACPCPVSTGAI